MRSGPGEKLSPPVAALLVAWILAALLTDHYPVASAAALAWTAAGGHLPRLAPVLAWASLPALLVSGALVGWEEALEASARILVAAMGAASAAASVSPLELQLALLRLGAPPAAAALPGLVYRQAAVIALAADAAMASFRGRGVRGLGLLRELPTPLVAHVARSASPLAEALYFKMPLWHGEYRVRPGRGDALVIMVIAGLTVSAALS